MFLALSVDWIGLNVISTHGQQDEHTQHEQDLLLSYYRICMHASHLAYAKSDQVNKLHAVVVHAKNVVSLLCICIFSTT